MPDEALVPSSSSPVPPWLEQTLKVVFSWVVLMPIAVIVAGKLLSQRLKIVGSSKQLFQIPLVGIFHIRADNDEVILGFTGFFVTLFLVSICAGKLVYERFKSQFGIDPGHFNSLCIFSSFATVVWSFIFYLLAKGGSSAVSSVTAEHTRLIEKLTTKLK